MRLSLLLCFCLQLEELSSKGHTDEEVAKSREASAVLRERLRHLAASQQAEDSSSSSSKA